MTRLLCVGDAILDITVSLHGELVRGSDSAGTVVVAAGGSAANVAAWAREAGVIARFVGAVGDDVGGDLVIDDLRRRGIELRVLRRAGHRTRGVAVVADGSGERSMVSDLDTTVTPTMSDLEAATEPWLDGVDWLHLTAYSWLNDVSRTVFERLRRDAHRRGVPVSIDPSSAELLRGHGDTAGVRSALADTDVLVPNADEAEVLCGSSDPAVAAQRLLELSETVAVTCGGDGVWVARRGREAFRVPAAPVRVVNTLGCGDAFAGGFVAGRLLGLDDRAAAQLAVELAGRAAAMVAAR